MTTGGDILGNDLKEQYFNWLYDHVVESKYPYRRLLNRLHEIPFTFILPMDENRMEDGLNLRYRFGLEAGIPQVEIVNKLDISECSVLEMMAALAIRCEENIMNDPEAGDQTARWFMEMLSNLELSCMDDDHYDQSYVDHRVDIFPVLLSAMKMPYSSKKNVHNLHMGSNFYNCVFRQSNVFSIRDNFPLQI